MVATLTASAVLAVTPSAATAARERACEPVRNPDPNTRHEGVDLTNIRTIKASCKTARRVTRRAHHKAPGYHLAARRSSTVDLERLEGPRRPARRPR